jgi:type IV pilus assembly protein PilM
MAKIQAVWALDIGQAALKALKLVPGEAPDQVVAETFDYVEYPKILSQPDADPEELVREALTTFIGRNDLKGTRVAIGVPGQAGLVKFIKLPPVEKKRIPDIVKFEARQQIPFALDEVIWDYQQIGADDSDDGDEGFTMAEVGLFAMKRDQITRAILPFKVAGIEVDIVQMGPIALYNFAAFDKPRAKEGETGSVVLLDVGADNTDLIITDGTRIWQRNVPIGGNHFTRALTKELKLTFAKAEHLKRNATKAPDPRAVFTAMRGIFNDFSSEVSRSIGFYSSVNRQAKILKIIGLGNGFKLPGLQKFLQQNLNYDVERLETFEHMAGDDVMGAPQFQENLMSFAVAYGLGVQGLARGPLKTNLLPPEIEQTRMIRRKKPWALAASALLMLGFATLFVADWNAWARVTSSSFKSAVSAADSASKTGAGYKSAYEAAKNDFNGKLAEGNALVESAGEGTSWPSLLQTINAAMPDPPKERRLDQNLPENQDVLRDLRVHIDAVLPRYRADLNADWFAQLDPLAKDRMHAFDRTTPPSGDGWVIQVVGHHYNPSKIGPNAKKLSAKEKEVAQGPIEYLIYDVIPRLWVPKLRQFGIHHACLAWVQLDSEWVTSKIAGANPLPPAPLMARAGGSGAAAGGSSSGSGGMGGSGGMSGMMAARGGAGMARGYGGGMGGGEMGQMDLSSMMSNMRPGMPAGKTKSKAEIKETTLTRTDFMIQFIWQPPDPTKPLEDLAEIHKKLDEAAKKNQGAIKPLDLAAVQAIERKSAEATQKALILQQQVLEGPPAGTTVTPPGGNAPGTPPAAAAGQPTATPPAAPPAAGAQAPPAKK